MSGTHLPNLETSTHSSDQIPTGDKSSLSVDEPASAPVLKAAIDPVTPPTTQQNITKQSNQTVGHTTESDASKPIFVRVLEDNSLSPFERKAVVFGWAGVLVAALTLLAASAAGRFAFQQFREMAAQTELLSRSVQQNKEDSAESTVATAKQLSLLQRQLTQEESATRLDQRAWVSVTVDISCSCFLLIVIVSFLLLRSVVLDKSFSNR